MKFWMIMALLCAFVTADAQMYRAGGSSRPSFGSRANQEEAEDSSVPGANSTIKTRTFSNYSSRQHDWSKGVQTQTVQTDTAGSKEFKDTSAEQAAQAVKALQGGTPQAPAAKSAAKAVAPAKAGGQQAAAANTSNAAAPAAPAGMADPAAMMQQMQSMMQGLGNMMGGAAAPGGSSAAGGANNGAAGMPAGMNVPGMPDMSSLLKAASAGQQPAQK